MDDWIKKNINRLRHIRKKTPEGEMEAIDRRIFRSAARDLRRRWKDLRRDRSGGILVMCYSLYGGGAERVACWLGEALAPEVRTIMLCAVEKEETFLNSDRTPVIVFPRFVGPTETVIRWQEIFTGWVKKSFHITAAVSFMFAMNSINVHTPGRARVICSERNNPAKREPELMVEIRRLYGRADCVVFQTNTVRELFGPDVAAHSTVIPNPVEARGERSPIRRRIVSIGRLAPQKNQAMLLRAFAQFYAEHPMYTLSVYGEGDLRDELLALSGELGIADAVTLEGHVRDVHSAIADAEFFVLSSDYEGMSNALLECMAMGFPCISTACEGSAEIIRSGENGLLTPIGDEEALCRAMCFFAENAAARERMGLAARQTAEQFCPKTVLEQWKHVILGAGRA